MRTLITGSRCGKRPAIITAWLVFGVLLASQGQSVKGQYGQRRPVTSGTMSPAMEAYRNRWLQYLKERTSTTPSSLHLFRRPVGGNTGYVSQSASTGLVINGYPCDRMHALFPSQSNPRMYHLCARNRDQWIIYHFFCPQGFYFDDGMRKCKMESRTTTTISPTSSPIPSTLPSSTSMLLSNRDTISTTTTTTLEVVTLLGGNNKFPMKMPQMTPSTTTLFTTFPTTASTTTTSTTTTTEAPEAFPEPEHGVTEINLSSEESSTEDQEMGIKNVSITSADEFLDVEATTNENEASDEESNEIPDDAKNTLISHKREPVVAVVTMPESNTMDSSSGGGRRPRIRQKKWHHVFHAHRAF